jgi:hypothetical protein
VRDADLRESHLARQRGRGLLVRGEAVAVHEDHCAGADARVERDLQLGAQRRQVERLQHLALRVDPLLRLDHPLVQQLRQHDMAFEQLRPGLVGDAQRVAEATCGDQQRAVALALEQRVGGHRGAHLHALDPIRRDGFTGAQAEQTTDALNRGIAVLLGVLGQQLQRLQLTFGRAADDVGEGTAAVDPELPAGEGRWGV